MSAFANNEDNIWCAASDGNISRVQELINSKVSTANDQDETGYSPMHAASSYGHVELLQYLLSVGGNVNLEDGDGDTPLFCCEDVDTFLLLMKNNANLHHVNHEGQNLLLKVIADENEEFIVYLLQNKYFDRSALPEDYKLPSEREAEEADVEMESEGDAGEGEAGPTQEQINAAFLEWAKHQGAESVVNMEQEPTTDNGNNSAPQGQL